MATESPTHVEGLGLQDKSIDRVHTALSNQNSRTFQGQVLIFQGLRITEVQGSAILTHIFPLSAYNSSRNSDMYAPQKLH